jgi:hypothetical protein
MTAKDPNAYGGPEKRHLKGWALPPFARDPRVRCTPADGDRLHPLRRNAKVDAEIAALCWPCPLRAECEAWGNRHSPAFGYWGGFSPRARRERAAGLKAAA